MIDIFKGRKTTDTELIYRLPGRSLKEYSRTKAGKQQAKGPKKLMKTRRK